jgi:hypothetical protein
MSKATYADHLARCKQCQWVDRYRVGKRCPFGRRLADREAKTAAKVPA